MLLDTQMLELLRGSAACFLSTLLPDGSPHVTETWVDTDGEHILINTVETHRKTRNVARDPRVSVAIADAAHPSRYFSVRGRVIGITRNGAREHIDELAHRYLGKPYPNFSGTDEQRVILTIAVDKILHRM